MRMKWHAQAISLALVLLTGLTSFALATARAQAMPVGKSEFCLGLTVVVVHVDADGAPVAVPHLCPDAATLYSALTDLSGPAATAQCALAVSYVAPKGGLTAQPAFDFAKARGPPSSV